jgi:F0F1-type ATP synthase beta subunit
VEQSGTIDGRVTAVRGAVLDVAFDGTALPPIDDALLIIPDKGAPIIAEVQPHLDEATVRAIALQSTAGLRRGVVAGSRRLRAALDELVHAGITMRRTAGLGTLAEALAAVRQVTEGLVMIDEALAQCERADSRWNLLYLHRRGLMSTGVDFLGDGDLPVTAS